MALFLFWEYGRQYDLLIGFNLVNLIIWLTLAFRIWLSLWLYSSVFNIVNLIIWLTLVLRIWSSLWFYSFKLNLMWRFYSYQDFYHVIGFTRWTSMTVFSWKNLFHIVNKTFRFFKRTAFIHVGKKCPLIHSYLQNNLMKENWKHHLTSNNTSWGALHSIDEVIVCHWVIRGNKFLFWNTWWSSMGLCTFVVILSTGGTILLLLIFVLELVDFFHLSLAIYPICH